MNREILDTWCERGIFGLVLAILIFGPLATGAVRTPDFLIIQGFTVVIMLLWIARLWLNPRAQLLWPPICWVAVVFTGYAIVRYLTADIEYVARLEVIRVIIYAVLFLAIVNNLYRQEFIPWIVVTIVSLAMLISFYAFYQFLTDSDKVWTFTKPYAHRGSGTYISPNNLAGFLEMILPLGLAWTLASRAKPVTKVFLGYCSLAIIVGIAVTLSRGGWTAATLSLGVLLILLSSQRAYRLPSVVLVTVVLLAGFFLIPRTHFFEARVKELTANDHFNDSARFELWRPALQLWRENPWWGIGPDHFNYRFRAYRPEAIQLEPDRVHNDYLNTLTDWGIVGAAIVTAAWVVMVIGVFKIWPAVRGSPGDFGTRKSNKFALVLGASLGLLAILVHSVVDFNMHIPANAILAITLMALLSSCWRFATNRFWVSAGLPVKVMATAALLTGAGFLGWQGSRRASEYYWLERGHRSPNYSTEQIAALEKAFAVEPMNFTTANEIGEGFRVQSWDGGDNYAQLAATAIDWFERAVKLNRYHSPSYMREGMCLDWLDRPDEAMQQFQQAIALDPNGYFTAAHVGWHYVQVADYAAAKTWFERSLRLQPGDNPVARSYLQIVTGRLLERAANPAKAKPLAQ